MGSREYQFNHRDAGLPEAAAALAHHNRDAPHIEQAVYARIVKPHPSHRFGHPPEASTAHRQR
jgi:hypothetical protein